MRVGRVTTTPAPERQPRRLRPADRPADRQVSCRRRRASERDHLSDFGVVVTGGAGRTVAAAAEQTAADTRNPMSRFSEWPSMTASCRVVRALSVAGANDVGRRIDADAAGRSHRARIGTAQEAAQRRNCCRARLRSGSPDPARNLQDRVVAMVAAAGLLAALAADISGMSRVETERIWLAFRSGRLCLCRTASWPSGRRGSTGGRDLGLAGQPPPRHGLVSRDRCGIQLVTSSVETP